MSGLTGGGKSLSTSETACNFVWHGPPVISDNGHKDTTNASRPRTNGVSAPVQGLADHKDTTDS